MIREVGEEYWGEWARDLGSAAGEETRVKWRVVSIEKVFRHGTYGDLVNAERIEGIAIERRIPDVYLFNP